MRKLIYHMLIGLLLIISLILGILLVSEKTENKRLTKEIEGSSDNLGAGRDWKREAIYKLPQKPGAYVLWEEGRVIHVGQSGNLKQRLSQHPKKKQMTSFDWYQTKTTDEARELEKKLKEELGYEGR